MQRVVPISARTEDEAALGVAVVSPQEKLEQALKAAMDRAFEEAIGMHLVPRPGVLDRAEIVRLGLAKPKRPESGWILNMGPVA